MRNSSSDPTDAEWLERFLRERCGISPSVKKVVAIPGWNVIERVLGQPRVVTGYGAGQAVVQSLAMNSEPSFNAKQVSAWVSELDQLCRDVEV